jgi:spore coat protein A
MQKLAATSLAALLAAGPPMPPEANELGWKDTVRVNSKTVTRMIVPFVGYSGR